jgi:hypothetical protein
MEEVRKQTMDHTESVRKELSEKIDAMPDRSGGVTAEHGGAGTMKPELREQVRLSLLRYGLRAFRLGWRCSI